jgi:hypothetical protein
MNALLFLALVSIVAAVIGLLTLILIMISARKQWQFATIEKGNTAFVVKGDDLDVILPNVDGHKISEEKDFEGRRWLVKVDTAGSPAQQKREMRRAFQSTLLPGTRHIQWFLWNKFGIRFVSWFYPHNRIHQVEISQNRLRQESEVETTADLRNRIAADKGDIDSIRYIFPRPMVAEQSELAGDNAKVNFLVLTTWRLVIPSIPIFYWKGRFMPLLDADVSAGIIDFCANYRAPVKMVEGMPVYVPNVDMEDEGVEITMAPLTYGLWLQIPKDRGSPLHRHLLGLNASPEYFTTLEDLDNGKPELARHLLSLLGGKPDPIPGGMTEKIAMGFIPKYGLALSDVDIISWQPDKATQALSNALQAKEIARREADGVRAEADGVRDATIAKATGEADRYRRLVDALIGRGVSPDVAAEVVRAQVEMENLKQWGGSTYVHGQAGVMVPTTPPPSPPAAP